LNDEDTWFFPSLWVASSLSVHPLSRRTFISGKVLSFERFRLLIRNYEISLETDAEEIKDDVLHVRVQGLALTEFELITIALVRLNAIT
jgi:hypothetical protein